MTLSEEKLTDQVINLGYLAHTYEKALLDILKVQPLLVEWFKANDIVFRNSPSEERTWENVAFAVYNRLVEADVIARRAIVYGAEEMTS
jgi:hypothetical protein